MTVREVIEGFKTMGIDTSGFVSDDFGMSESIIYHLLITSRARIIRDRKKLESFSDSMIQSLLCIELEEVDKAECGLLLKSDCTVLKSTCALPNLIENIGVSFQLGDSIDVIRWDRVSGKLKSNIPRIKKATYASIRSVDGGQYLYIFNNIHLKNAMVMGIFEDPIKAIQFCDQSEEAKCNPMDLDFHTDYHIIEPVLKLTWDTALRVRSGAKPDLLNNDNNLQ